jgi:succinate dehydrogenase/fumarate reductase flavoprotein subunit
MDSKPGHGNPDKDAGVVGSDLQAEAGSRLSRRRFLAAAGLTAGSAAVGGSFAAQEAFAASSANYVNTKLPSKWAREADVIVVGSGGAGLNAAIAARASGAKVLILERASLIGGTTLKSGGEYWIPNNPVLRSKGLTDPRDWALKYMARLSYPSIYDADSPRLGLPKLQYDLLATFYDRGPEMVSHMSKIGAYDSVIQPTMGYPQTSRMDVGDPDYHADLPEDHAPHGRGLNAVKKGSKAGGGSNLILNQQAWLQRHHVPFVYNARVVGVYRNSAGAIVGVQVEQGHKTLAMRARKAVIFGSGGFTQDPAKALSFLRGPIFGGCGVPTNTGDFVDIGLALGAQLGNMNNAFWVQNLVEQAIQYSSVADEVWIPYGDSMIYVNKYGNRFTNEKMVYNERTQSHFHWEATQSEYTQLVQFMLYDSAVANSTLQWAFRFGNVPLPGQSAPYVIKGNTWSELAANINSRLAKIAGKGSITGRVTPLVQLDENFVTNLSNTINRYNSFAANGADPDYGRGSTPIQLAWGGPARAGNTKNPEMYPFSTSGPYYCIILGGGTLDTKGGPVINVHAQVLHVSGKVIPGLYGAGNCIASPAGQAYWSGGGTIGPGLTYGYIAGLNAAKEHVKPLT